MSEQDVYPKNNKLEQLNKLLETLGLEETKIIVKDGVRIAKSGDITDSMLAELSKIFPKIPQGINNCYDVSEYVMDVNEDFSTIESRQSGTIVNGNHCINFGKRLLVDMKINSYLGGICDILVVALPDNYTDSIDSYESFATTIYGGNWKHLSKEGHNQYRRIIEEARERARKRRHNF